MRGKRYIGLFLLMLILGMPFIQEMTAYAEDKQGETQEETFKPTVFRVYPANPECETTIDEYFGVKEYIVDYLEMCEEKQYYLGTPYFENLPECNSCMIPNWEGADGINNGMNCTGFVAKVFQMLGADLNQITTRLPGKYGNACNWNDTAAKYCQTYRFNSIEEALGSGVLEKGDLLYFEPNWGIKGVDCHIGFFWGNTSDENKFWHSAENLGNVITEIQSVSSYKYLYVFKTTNKVDPTGNSGGEWIYTDGIWYFKNKEGINVTGWQLIKRVWYYFNEEGQMQTGWICLNDEWYYLKENGAMETGWIYLEDAWYYLNSSGVKSTNTWVGNYWLKEDGVMATSEWVDDGKYYVDSNGAYVRNSWIYIDGIWYYLNQYGFKEIGWLLKYGTWYYLNELGEMQTGWVCLNDQWYYLQESGAMAAGWTYLEDAWYHLNSSGVRSSNTWVGDYWLKEDGIMATNEWVDAGRYYVDSNGVYVRSSWILVDETWYYLNQYGLKETGWLLKNGFWYYLNEAGEMVTDEWVDNDNYYVDQNGVYVEDAIKPDTLLD